MNLLNRYSQQAKLLGEQGSRELGEVYDRQTCADNSFVCVRVIQEEGMTLSPELGNERMESGVAGCISRGLLHCGFH
jgi:hypothetical protein